MAAAAKHAATFSYKLSVRRRSPRQTTEATQVGHSFCYSVFKRNTWCAATSLQRVLRARQCTGKCASRRILTIQLDA